MISLKIIGWSDSYVIIFVICHLALISVKHTIIN
jgi:hypothetical protein